MKLLVLLPLLALPWTVAAAPPEPKGKAPALDVRAIPRMAFSPVNVLVIAELKGGDDLEEYYCPEVEFFWDDGGKSVQEADCPPFEPGTKIERRYSAEHYYERAGNYGVTVILRRAGKVLRKQTFRLNVRAGLGDPSEVPEN